METITWYIFQTFQSFFIVVRMSRHITVTAKRFCLGGGCYVVITHIKVICKPCAESAMVTIQVSTSIPALSSRGLTLCAVHDHSIDHTPETEREKKSDLVRVSAEDFKK